MWLCLHILTLRNLEVQLFGLVESLTWVQLFLACLLVCFCIFPFWEHQFTPGKSFENLYAYSVSMYHASTLKIRRMWHGRLMFVWHWLCFFSRPQAIGELNPEVRVWEKTFLAWVTHSCDVLKPFFLSKILGWHIAEIGFQPINSASVRNLPFPPI